MAPKRKPGEKNKKTKANKKARVEAPASSSPHNSNNTLQFPADFPLEILQQIVSELDDISATCFALVNMRCMDAVKVHQDAESKKELRERRAAQSGHQSSSSGNNGADKNATNSDASTVIAPYFSPPRMASMGDQHTETDGRSWGLPALLQNWMPDDYAWNYWECKFMTRRVLRVYARDWTEEQKGKLEEEKEARKARREERREAKYDRQEERAERHAEVRARKEIEFEWLEQPLTVEKEEEEEKEELDNGDAEELEDGSAGNGSDNPNGSDGESREPPPLSREDEEYWEVLSLYPMEYRLAMPESLSSSESGEKTHTTTDDNVSEEDVEVLFLLDPKDEEAEKACAPASSSSASSSSASSSDS